MEIAEDTQNVVIEPASNDVDPDGDQLTVTVGVPPNNGAIVQQGNTIIYTPNSNFFGEDVIAYAVHDPGGLQNIAYIHINVTPVNDAPVAVADASSTAEDTEVRISVLANDIDVDGPQLRIQSISQQPTNGVARIDGDAIVYTPNGNFNGTDTLKYVVSDGEKTSEATVTVTVTPVNDAPVAVADPVLDATEDTGLTLNSILGNDTDAEGDALKIVIETNPAHGTIEFRNDGSVVYMPNQNYFGNDTFTYRANDGKVNSNNSVTVTINVKGVNDPPQLDGGTPNPQAKVNEGYTLKFIDVDGDPLTVTAFSSNPTPSWLAIAQQGNGLAILSGTPSNEDAAYGQRDYTFTVEVSDSKDKISLVIPVKVIGGAPPPPTPTDTPLPPQPPPADQTPVEPTTQPTPETSPLPSPTAEPTTTP